MLLSERDCSYLIDMLECCNDISSFTADITFDFFAEDKMRRLATERQLEILGEAANHISLSAQNSLPQIDWTRIIGMRNKLAHDYGEILANRVWNIVKTKISILQEQLNDLIAENCSQYTSEVRDD